MDASQFEVLLDEMQTQTPDDGDEDDTAVVSSSSSSSVVPSYMASVLPQESVLLLEHPAPQELLRKRIEKIQCILKAVTTNDNTNNNYKTAQSATPPPPAISWKYRNLHNIPNEIQEFASTMGVKDMLGTDDANILGLAILGWQPIMERRWMIVEDDNDDDNKTAAAATLLVSMGCPLCMAVMELKCCSSSLAAVSSNAAGKKDKDMGKQQQEGGGSGGGGGACNEDDRPMKRLRTTTQAKQLYQSDPQEAHRHYCPYKCGFPSSITDKKDPVWKPMLKRLSDENNNASSGSGSGSCNLIAANNNGPSSDVAAVPLKDLDASIRKARRILRAGIATKTIDLSS